MSTTMIVKPIPAIAANRIAGMFSISEVWSYRPRLLGRAMFWLAIFLGACLLPSAASAQQPTDDEIMRAVRTVRNAEAMSLVPMLPANTIVTNDLRDRIASAKRFLTLPTTAEGIKVLDARLADEFLKQDAQERLFGFKFGAGLSVTTRHRKNAIKDATVDSNKIVRVTKEDETSIGYLLEAHYFFVPDRSFLSLPTGNWGIGPFVAIQAGSDKAVSGLGFGVMLGLRQLGAGVVPTSNLSWNLGIGALYDPSVKVLGNGIIADRPLPAGESVLRTTEVGGWGLMLMSSFNF